MFNDAMEERGRIGQLRNRWRSYGASLFARAMDDNLDGIAAELSEVVCKCYPHPSTVVLATAVFGELGSASQRDDESAGLKERDVVCLVVDAAVHVPSERLINAWELDTSATPRVIELTCCSTLLLHHERALTVPSPQACCH